MSIKDLLPIISKRIVLRRLLASDLVSFQSYRHDPEVGRYQGWEITTDPEAESFLAEMHKANLLEPGKWSQLGIACRKTDNLIGDVGICVSEDMHVAEIGFSMNRNSQGQGLASEAVSEAIQLIFNRTEVKQIRGITDSRNIPSIRLLKRVGMLKTESLESVFRGEPCIEYVFTLYR